MPSFLTIGDFARATHLSIKTLRHYHETGLLAPAEVDGHTGYRRYTTSQIPTAQVIRRFRELDMPLDDIRAVLAAKDLDTRNALVAAHLERLESALTRTQSAVASLRNLLQQPKQSARIEQRSVPATAAIAITGVVDSKDLSLWWHGAFAELYATLAAQQATPAGPAAGIYANALFSEGRGEATIFVPCDARLRTMGRVQPFEAPAIELATIMHAGSHADIDLAYGALATYVTEHALAIEAPLREVYHVGPHDTADAALWRTEVGWPVFQTTR